MADPQFGFRGVDDYGDYLVTDRLETNVVSWLQWGLLGIGAFDNVQVGDLSAHGAKDRSRLRPVSDPRYPAGTVWQGLRSQWVWESGVPYAVQPRAFSGVYVSGTFYSPTGATHPHRVSYPEGRVYFSGAVPTGATVQAGHSYRHVQVHRADAPWFQTVTYRSFRADDAQWEQPAGSGGAWDILAQNRIQLPCMVVEPVPRTELKALEIGNYARVHRQDVLVHILAETPWEEAKGHDILVSQFDKRIPTFDPELATVPLKFDGSLTSGAKTFPELVGLHPWRQVRIAGVGAVDNGEVAKSLYWCTVKLTCELDVA
jgi:hypothetical protein